MLDQIQGHFIVCGHVGKVAVDEHTSQGMKVAVTECVPHCARACTTDCIHYLQDDATKEAEFSSGSPLASRTLAQLDAVAKARALVIGAAISPEDSIALNQAPQTALTLGTRIMPLGRTAQLHALWHDLTATEICPLPFDGRRSFISLSSSSRIPGKQ